MVCKVHHPHQYFVSVDRNVAPQSLGHTATVSNHIKMTRFLQILLLVLLINSCKTDEKKEVIDELLIFGYSGFCFKDSLNQIYHSDEIFYNDSVKLEHDSTRLDIRQYFEFKKDSVVNVAIRRPRKNTEYIKIAQSDTIGFEKLINTTLLNKQYKIKYSFKDNETAIYDGWHFTLYYKTSRNKEFSIDYIPIRLPDSLRTLHKFVEKIIIKDNPELTKYFEYNTMITNKAKSLFKKFPPPQFRKSIRFSAPKIVEDGNN